MATPEGERLPYDEDEQTRHAAGRVGRLIRDRWHLDELLGVGGMAAVYAATHRNGKRVAIKMMHPELSHHADARRRFIDEGYLANRVAHTGVVSIIDDEIAEDGSAFLVMDLLEGETLDIRITRNERLEALEFLGLMDDLLDVLAAAHAKGIVHRDIKPNNIFVTRTGQVKLLDFGIARLADASRPNTTGSGSTVGTPAFMAPEQARGRSDELDGRTDIWAVGATMFVALTGRSVHEADTNNEQLLAAMTQPAPSIGSVLPGLPKALVDLIDRALAFEKDARWSDARAMQCALREVHANLIEQQAGSRLSRDSLVSLEELTPPIASHAPVTLTTGRALALSQSGSLRSFHPKKQRHRTLALGTGLLVLASVLWLGSKHRDALRKVAAAASGPMAAETAAVSPLATIESNSEAPPSAPAPLATVAPSPVEHEFSDGKQSASTMHDESMRGPKSPHALPKVSARPGANKVTTVSVPPAAPPLPPPASSPPPDPLERRR